MINCDAKSGAEMNKEELKAKLLSEAEAVIEAMLGKKGPREQMTMREIVALALESGQQVEAAVVGVLSQESAARPQEEIVCEQCGRRMHDKGKRLRDIVTSAGEARLERDYYYCGQCKVGRFPPG